MLVNNWLKSYVMSQVHMLGGGGGGGVTLQVIFSDLPWSTYHVCPFQYMYSQMHKLKP